MCNRDACLDSKARELQMKLDKKAEDTQLMIADIRFISFFHLSHFINLVCQRVITNYGTNRPEFSSLKGEITFVFISSSLS